jgi:CBS-domain-containing membrane protein
MTPKVWTIHEDDALEEAAKTMKAKRVRRLVVLDREERPVGIATLGDLAHHGETAEIGGDVLRSISEPANPQRISDRQEALPAFARVVRT